MTGGAEPVTEEKVATKNRPQTTPTVTVSCTPPLLDTLIELVKNLSGDDREALRKTLEFGDPNGGGDI
jgi:hypothetical protein